MNAIALVVADKRAIARAPATDVGRARRVGSAQLSKWLALALLPLNFPSIKKSQAPPGPMPLFHGKFLIFKCLKIRSHARHFPV